MISLPRLLFCLLFFSYLKPAAGQIWSPVGTGTDGGVLAFATYNAELYVGGGFHKAGGVSVKNIAKWNGTTWDSAGSGLNSQVSALAVYKGELYAGGWFHISGGSPENFIAKWNGSTWTSVGGGINGIVSSLAVYNGSLFAGGLFDTAGNVPASNIAKWNGTSWAPLGAGVQGPNNPMAKVLCVYNNKLYVGGWFDTAGAKPANYIAAWNDTVWSYLGKGLNGYVGAMKVYNSALIVAGVFTTVDTMNTGTIAQWDGNKWSDIGGNAIIGSAPAAMEIFNSLLVIGCSGQPHHVWSWNGATFSTMGPPIAGVNTLATYNAKLYLGGSFGLSSSPLKNIAVWDPTNGIAEYQMKGKINCFPNPATAYITFKSEDYKTPFQLDIYDAVGKLVYSKIISAPIETINLEEHNFRPGFYYSRADLNAGFPVWNKFVLSGTEK